MFAGADKEQSYTYDAVGNLTSVSSPNVAWYNRVYTYDALNRLEHAEGPYGVVDYTYDGVGNRLTKVVNDQTETYTYVTGTNKIQDITGPVSYSYDANGNITGIGNKVLTYNQNNRLIRVEEDSTVLGEYTYNGLGQRIIKTADGVTTVFHYDFNGNLIAESDENGSFNYECLYKGGSRLALVDAGSGEIYSFLNDRLGTPQMLADSTNTIVWEGVYNPFGEADVNPNSSIVNNFRFAGQYYDEETGFHYNYHRYYDPQTGRYLRADPIGFEGGINLYLYANLNSINSIDFYGLKDWTIHRRGFSFSALIVSFSYQTVEFVSDCDENMMRTIKTYKVVGLGLTMGVQGMVWGNWGGEKDEIKGYLGNTNVYKEEPNPITGISVSGPSAGIIKGGTIASASLDFTSFADVHAATTGKRLGLSIFNFEGQRYKLISIRTVSCCE